jgi:hypothetical protein
VRGRAAFAHPESMIVAIGDGCSVLTGSCGVYAAAWSDTSRRYPSGSAAVGAVWSASTSSGATCCGAVHSVVAGAEPECGVVVVTRRVEGVRTSTALRGVRVATVVCGLNHTLALCVSGDVFGWGDNTLGQVGVGAVSESVSDPARVCGDVDAVSAGWGHSAAVTRDRRLFTWGWNLYSQLGVGATGNQSSPVVRRSSCRRAGVS